MLLFRLCLEIGCPHPDYLRQYLNGRQIGEWIAYANVEPFGMQHHETLHGIRCALFANAHKRENDTAARITDFMPSYEEPEPDWKAIRAAIRAAKGLD